MGDKIRRIRCNTRKCTGFIDTNGSESPVCKDGNWQFHCLVCGFWNLMSETGTMKATSKQEFDLQRLPTHLRMSLQVTRGPTGGV